MDWKSNKKANKGYTTSRSYIVHVPSQVGGDFVYKYSEEIDEVIIPWHTERVFEWTDEQGISGSKISEKIIVKGNVSPNEVEKAIFNFFKPQSVRYREKKETKCGLSIDKGSVTWDPLVVKDIQAIENEERVLLCNGKTLHIRAEEIEAIYKLSQDDRKSVPIQLGVIFLYLDFSRVELERKKGKEESLV